MSKNPDPKAIALWRYEQIEEALDERLHNDARGRILRRMSKTPVRWPSGVTKKISLATLYRWVDRYRRAGLEALLPKVRADRGSIQKPLDEDVVDEALRLLTKDPEASFTFLIGVLEAKFVERKLRIKRSTLQRRLQNDATYQRIKRAKKRARRRTRFVAKAPHDIWQTDAKGPVTIRLVTGAELVFHVVSVIDDATRAILAAIVALTPNLAAAVLAFRIATLRWGLPKSLYADRASIFDSKAFRGGLADCGEYRIPTKPRNAPARGKIEAYHRTLVLWFTKRLHSQRVVDLVHLQQLLDGVIQSLYQSHKHRGLKMSPEAALAGRVSSRAIPPARLYDAFRKEKRLKAHPKTGEVEIDQKTYIVPDELRGQRLTFLVDPPAQVPPQVVHPQSQDHLELRTAEIKPEDRQDDDHDIERWGDGPLQTIYDAWRGHRRPQAEPGFGLPEIYALLSQACGRHVPHSDAEAALVQHMYRDIGPLPRIATEKAMRAIGEHLGSQRPVKTYLDALAARVHSHHPTPDPKRTP